MCGIAGVFHAGRAQADPAWLTSMTLALQHRGPDGSGMHAAGHMGIAMTRLAIIDVAGGNQPIWNEERTIALVCNGEIYNYQDLRRDLEQKGHHFRTHSDVEVILHLYEDEGDSCFRHLNGMFGAAIADTRTGRMVLGRDRFGQKSLYLWQRPGFVAFASELKALTVLPGFSREISKDALAGFLSFRYIPAPHSIYNEVRKLPPGSFFTIERDGKSRTERYWQIRIPPVGRPATSGDDIRTRLMESVDRHLMSERPLGVFLSGGIDSACVVACMHDMGHRQIHTFTVGFEGFKENEFDNARRVARHFDTVHTEVILKPETFFESLPEVLFSLDEPMADLTSVPVYHLSKRAREDVVVVLSGEGSDELLAGYGGMNDLVRLFEKLHRWRFLQPAAKLLRRLPWPGALQEKFDTLSGSDADYLDRNPMSMGQVFDDEFVRRECPELSQCGASKGALSAYFRARQDWQGLDLYLGGLIENWLPDDLLVKADRMSMAHSIELRCPFLDAEFADYCAALPLADRAAAAPGEYSRKIALKKMFAPRLPEGIAYQSKKGFVIPVYTWLGSHFADLASRELARPEAFGSSLFRRKSLDTMLAAAQAGDQLSQRRVWSILVLNLWGDRNL